MNFKVGDEVIITDYSKTLMDVRFSKGKIFIIAKIKPIGKDYSASVPEDEIVAFTEDDFFLRLDCIRHLTKLEKALR